jgi:uncharacterized protein YjdB
VSVRSPRAHVRDKGWPPFVRENDVSGTVGEARRLEAFRIRLAGSAAFDVCYSVHVQCHGWMPVTADVARYLSHHVLSPLATFAPMSSAMGSPAWG